MADEVMRDDSVQPENQGEQNVTQEEVKVQEQTPEVENESGLLTEEEFERLTKALDEGNFEEFVSSLGEDAKKKFQSFLDSKITKAIKTREERLKKQQEEERLKQERKFEELLKMRERELVELKKQVMLRDAGFPVELGSLVQGDTEEQIAESIKALQTILNKTVEEKVQSLIEERLKGRTPQQTKEPTLPKISKDALKRMTPEQINDLFERGELQKILRGG